MLSKPTRWGLLLFVLPLFFILIITPTLAAPPERPRLDDPTPTPAPTFWAGETQGWLWSGGDVEDKITVPADNTAWV